MLINFRRKILFLIFDLLYTSFSWAYDWISNFVSLGNWQLWIKETTVFINSNKVLEIGHGPGYLLCDLFNESYCAYGIDASKEMSKRANKNIQKLSLEFNHNQLPTKHIPVLIRGNGQLLPFSNNSFPCIIATFPAPFIYFPNTIKEINRVLTPGGRLIILNSAIFTKTSLSTQFIISIYRIFGFWDNSSLYFSSTTHQMNKFGFETKITNINRNSSVLSFIIATKKT